MVDEITSGSCIALEISAGRVSFSSASSTETKDQNNNIVAHFRHFVGPYDPEIAKRIRPDSLRAQFGEDKVKNAIHCTDLAEDGELEVWISRGFWIHSFREGSILFPNSRVVRKTIH